MNKHDHIVEWLWLWTMFSVCWIIFAILAFGCTTVSSCKAHCYKSVDNILVCDDLCEDKK